MRSIAGRIEKLEKAMSVGKERKVSEIIICGPWGGGTPEETQQQESLGSPETWITYQEQLATAREDQDDCDSRIIVIHLSVERELQARQFQNTSLEEQKRAERIHEYRTKFEHLMCALVAPDE